MLHLILGGAALQRCGNRITLNAALAAAGRRVLQRDFFRSLLGTNPYGY
ncbi:hypothetical protein SBA7_460006 [Candidatus Sulfotelmatobacter sp. SbA7]|nr:hypothetical protein SBA7_460006 [Candidatus Sulfotelmatobacter sp. SbA7]